MGRYTREELEQGDLRWDALTPDEWLPASVRAIEELRATGRITPYEKEYLRKDGSRWSALLAATQLGPGEAVEFGVDLTDLRAAEAAAAGEHERREQHEREFVANAAHELRTPLTAIVAAVEALEAGAKDLPAQRDRFLRHLKREAARLASLCDSLLVLAQIDSTPEVPRRPVPLRPLLEDVARRLHAYPGVAVGVEAPAALVVVTNRGLAERVIANLAENAAKHTREGGIELRARAADAAVVVEVRDSGPGIGAMTTSRAFDRFYRGGARGADGFGLGLSIAHQAAIAIGGELSLESPAEGGTVGRLVLPAAP
jgi:signal transduction histidine kinase